MAMTYAVGDTIWVPMVVLGKADLGSVRCVTSDGTFLTLTDNLLKSDCFGISAATMKGSNIKLQTTTPTTVTLARDPSMTWVQHKI